MAMCRLFCAKLVLALLILASWGERVKVESLVDQHDVLAELPGAPTNHTGRKRRVTFDEVAMQASPGPCANPVIGEKPNWQDYILDSCIEHNEYNVEHFEGETAHPSKCTDSTKYLVRQGERYCCAAALPELPVLEDQCCRVLRIWQYNHEYKDRSFDELEDADRMRSYETLHCGGDTLGDIIEDTPMETPANDLENTKDNTPGDILGDAPDTQKHTSCTTDCGGRLGMHKQLAADECGMCEEKDRKYGAKGGGQSCSKLAVPLGSTRNGFSVDKKKESKTCCWTFKCTSKE